MENFKPVIKIAISAIKGAFVALIGLIILTTIIAFPYGGPLILLYYWGYVVFYILPVALLIGAFFGLYSLSKEALNSEKLKRKPMSRTSRLAIVLIFLLIIGLISVPYLTLNQNGQVEHGAKWFYVDSHDEDLSISEQNRSACDTQLVLFVLEVYRYHDVVCSQEVLDYLEAVEDERVRMTYRVTYDFGSPRSYQLIAVGTVSISWDDWVGSWGGCGGKYSHPCNSPQAQNGSHLYQSSWAGE